MIAYLRRQSRIAWFRDTLKKARAYRANVRREFRERQDAIASLRPVGKGGEFRIKYAGPGWAIYKFVVDVWVEVEWFALLDSAINWCHGER